MSGVEFDQVYLSFFEMGPSLREKWSECHWRLRLEEGTHRLLLDQHKRLLVVLFVKKSVERRLVEMWEKKYISHWWTFSPISTSHWWTYANCWSAAGGGEGRLWVYEKDRGEEVAAWEREEIWERYERDQMRCYFLSYLSACTAGPGDTN